MEKFKKFTEPFRLLDRERIKKIHTKSKNNLPKKYSDINYQEIININKLIFQEVADNIIENKSGVVLDGFGYFCIWRSPERLRIRNLFKDNEGEFFFNPHSKGYFYLPTLFTNVLSSTILKGWSLDGSFNHKIKSKMSVKIRNGFKYNILYSLVKSLKLKYKNQQNRKLIKLRNGSNFK